MYETLRTKLELAGVQPAFRSAACAVVMPMLVPDGEGRWYLAEDYAFCERARQSGIRIMADTRIRLYHVGSHGYGWEDPGHEIPRSHSCIHHFTPRFPPEMPG